MSKLDYPNNIASSSTFTKRTVDLLKIYQNFQEIQDEWQNGTNTDLSVNTAKATNINNAESTANIIGTPGNTNYYGKANSLVFNNFIVRKVKASSGNTYYENNMTDVHLNQITLDDSASQPVSTSVGFILWDSSAVHAITGTHLRFPISFRYKSNSGTDGAGSLVFVFNEYNLADDPYIKSIIVPKLSVTTTYVYGQVYVDIPLATVANGTGLEIGVASTTAQTLFDNVSAYNNKSAFIMFGKK